MIKEEGWGRPVRMGCGYTKIRTEGSALSIQVFWCMPEQDRQS
jgi:hypothetical protein